MNSTLNEAEGGAMITGFVKPLVWKRSQAEDWKGPRVENLCADSIFGTYWTSPNAWRQPPHTPIWIPASDPEAAAQADYEARIMSALEIVKVAP